MVSATSLVGFGQKIHTKALMCIENFSSLSAQLFTKTASVLDFSNRAGQAARISSSVPLSWSFTARDLESFFCAYDRKASLTDFKRDGDSVGESSRRRLTR